MYYTLMNRSGVEELAGNAARRFLQPGQRCLDIEAFLRERLNTQVVYAVLDEKDADKIGFLSDGKTPVTIRKEGRTSEVVFPRGTVVADERLVLWGRNHMRRFTLAHEAGHIVLEKLMPRPQWTGEGEDGEKIYDAAQMRTLHQVRERQASQFAAALLMPEFVVQELFAEQFGGALLRIFGQGLMLTEDRLRIWHMANACGVSFEAMLRRMKGLGLVEYRPADEYCEIFDL